MNSSITHIRQATPVAALTALLIGLAMTASAQKTTLTVDAGSPGKPISNDIVGIFFEDLSYAADGGLYAELVQNRSFEYSAADHGGWNSLTSWELVQQAGSKAELLTDTKEPLHSNNPNYAVLRIPGGSRGAGIKNNGFDGIPAKEGASYVFSVFARQLTPAGGSLTVRLESKSGSVIAEAQLPKPGTAWKKSTVVLQAKSTDNDARLVLLASGPGDIALDMISLFPRNTFKNRPNGLRADLAQTIADMKPKFMRFPGGCLVHGDGLDNIYHWKNTIGPVEQRKGQPNIWHYHQSVGLGYFEYFQFCEDIGAKPLPVVAAGVCCQNSDVPIHKKYGVGQQGLPMEDMPAYVQDVLDLIEYANGPATSTWGAKRAAAGHPEPFGLKYLGVGNEDKITPVFEERFKMIHAAVKAKHPEITVIGTVGPAPDDDDYRNGWKIANDMKLEMVDEHCYRAPKWFWDNLNRWDTYDRNHSKVYLGEWAAHDDKRRTTLRSAIAEAAYLTAIERNGDLVTMASYAPLLAKKDHTHWSPNLIHFDNTTVYPTINYHVQQLFSIHSGDHYLTTTLGDLPAGRHFAASSVHDSKSGDLILKIVNGDAEPMALDIRLTAGKGLSAKASMTILTGPDPAAANDYGSPRTVLPETSTLAVSPAFNYQAPANSLTIVRIPRR